MWDFLIFYSLSQFVEAMESKTKHYPFFEVSLLLFEKILTFFPGLDPEENHSFFKLVDTLLSDIMQMASYVSRVDASLEMSTYQVNLNGFHLL